MEEKKELEIVSGDGSNLDISPVYEHLNTDTEKKEKPKNIVLPKPMENRKTTDKTEENENDDIVADDEGENLKQKEN